MRIRKYLGVSRSVLVVICCATSFALGQTTTFSYQGHMNSGAAPANGNYEMQFKLFDALTVGAQVGGTVTDASVAVMNGTFAVTLDFGSAPFDGGASRYLEIAVRPAGNPNPFTILSPRQQIRSAPYSIQAKNATNAVNAVNAVSATSATNALSLGGIAANQYLQTNGNGSGLTDLNAGSVTTGTLSNARLGQIPTANIADSAVTAAKIADAQVIKSINTLKDDVTLAAGSNITITPAGNTLTIAATGGGSGCPSPCTAAIFNATQQYDLGGGRILSAPGASNLFVGLNAAATGPTGLDNTYVGNSAGSASTTGDANSFFGVSAGFNNRASSNSFFGRSAGFQNTDGNRNSFFGVQAGRDNSTGLENSLFGWRAGIGNNGHANSFFGSQAGRSNVAGGANSFFGWEAGQANVGGNLNSFFGRLSGFDNTEGDGNSFFGNFAGRSNTVGDNNTAIGDTANFGSPDLTNATAIGANALVSQSNSLVLGSIFGVNGATADTRVGIGTTVPGAKLHVVSSGLSVSVAGTSSANGVGLFGSSSGGTGGIALRGSGTSWFKDDTTPLSAVNAGSGTGIAIGSVPSLNYGYIFAIDYSSFTTKVLALNAPGGNVGIGTTTPDQTLSVNGNASKLGGGSWLAFSDERLKNIQGRFTPGLAAVLRLQPVVYQYKANNAMGIKAEGKHVGFSAQAVEELIPEAVTKNDRGYRLVNNDPIMWAMLNAIKEQQKIIENQQHQIEALTKLICTTQPQAQMCKEQEK